MFFMQHLSAADFSRAIQVTVGVPFVIDPAADCGVHRTTMSNMNGFYYPSPNQSTTYTPTLFTYTVENYTGFGGAVGRVYTIMPIATGVTSFRMTVSYYQGSNGNIYTHSITYTFNIVEVTSIDGLNDFSLSIGETETLNPTITNQFAEASLTWKSSNKSVATVDADGKVTAVGVGASKVTCTAQNGVSANCTVTVNPIYVSSITLNETLKEMMTKEKFQLEATALPNNATDKSVTWSSTNEAVAVVSESGQVYAVGAGTCKIRATANDGSGKTASCTVTVTNSSLQGDMNNDGVLSVTDVVKLINMILQQ